MYRSCDRLRKAITVRILVCGHHENTPISARVTEVDYDAGLIKNANLNAVRRKSVDFDQ